MKCKVCGGDCGLVHRAGSMANTASNIPDMANNSMANTYKYRNAEKRREYQRELMRKRRGTK